MRTKEEVLGAMDLVTFLYWCRFDFKFFAENLLELTDCGGIQSFHEEWVELMENNRFVMIQAPSGFAKTTIFEAYAIWIAWRYVGKKIMIIANTEDRAKQIIDDISNFIEKNEIIADLKPKNYRETWNKQELRTSTKCRIFSKPYTPNMRGERSDFTLADEADSEAYRNTKIFQEHVLSRLNPNSKIILLSTPDSSTGLMSYILDIDKKNMWTFKKYEAIINCKDGDLTTGESIWKERFSMEELINKLYTMGESAFRKVFMCDIKAESEDSLFKLKYILDCYDRTYKFEEKPESGLVVIGCDFAYSSGPKADFTVYVVVEKLNGFIIIRKIDILPKGVTLKIKTDRIYELFLQYNNPIIVCDGSNIGSDVVDDLYSKGMGVIVQSFAEAERKDLLRVLQNVIENKKLVIPRNPECFEEIEITNKLTEQLIGFMEKESEVTKRRSIIASTASHDDIAMALAMAVKEATRQITDSFY